MLKAVSKKYLLEYAEMKFSTPFILLLALAIQPVALHTLARAEIAEPQQQSDVWTFSPESSAEYEAHVKLLLVIDDTVIGRTNKVTGSITIPAGEPSDPLSRLPVRAEVFIDASTFRSGNGVRDKNVKEILDVGKYPQIKFLLLSIEALKSQDSSLNGTFAVRGMLEVHGAQKEIAFPVTVEMGMRELRIKGVAQVRYSDFDIQPPTLALFIRRAEDSINFKVALVAVRK